jgi:hypothetical protein
MNDNAPSTRSKNVHQILQAFGWNATLRNSVVHAEEPSFEPQPMKFLAGQARSMTAHQIEQADPNYIIFEDSARDADWQQLEKAAADVGSTAKVMSQTRFIDQLWKASVAVERAFDDAQLQGELPFPMPKRTGLRPTEQHVDQTLAFRGQDISDFQLLTIGLPSGVGALAIVADAGFGKTELLKYYEWRFATLYQNAVVNSRTTMLPQIALRIPLREAHELTLESISELLTSGAGDCTPLPAIRGAQALQMLLNCRRVILLLDGLDELKLPPDRLGDRLQRLRRIALNGGSVVLATRQGHLQSALSVNAKFDSSEIATIQPLPRDLAIELLTVHNYPASVAEQVYAALPQDVNGVPLFLLLAAFTRLEVGDAVTVTSPADTLLLLIERFCDRESQRLHIGALEQMTALTALARWLRALGPLSREQALEVLDLEEDAPQARFIDNPHALLEKSGNTLVGFKYAQFGILFSAKAIADEWISEGFAACQSEFSEMLETGVSQYLASLVPDHIVAESWQAACTDRQARYHKYTRRNLLAIALAKLMERAAADPPAQRSAALELILGNRDLADMHLNELALERFDLTGWDLRRLRSTFGAITYCTGFKHAFYDDSLRKLESLDGCDLGDQDENRDDSAALANGASRLRRLTRHWVSVAGERRRIQPEVRLSTTPDHDGCMILAQAGYIKQETHVSGGKYWAYTDKGHDLFMDAWDFLLIGSPDPEAGLDHDVIAQRPEIRDLLITLGANKKRHHIKWGVDS